MTPSEINLGFFLAVHRVYVQAGAEPPFMDLSQPAPVEPGFRSGPEVVARDLSVMKPGRGAGSARAGMFPCPHCGRVYPVRSWLADHVHRCHDGVM